jgi:hypothetical protein
MQTNKKVGAGPGPKPSGTLRLVQGCLLLQKLALLVVLRESCGDCKFRGSKCGRPLYVQYVCMYATDAVTVAGAEAVAWKIS